INGQPFKIVGVLEETGSQDDGLIFIDLAESQRLFNKPALISLIEVAALCYDCPIEEIVAQTSDKLPNAKVMAIQKTINSKMETIQQFQNFSIGISIVIMLVGALIAFTTISASVSERKMEIGIFRSIGFRQRHIMKIILLEAFLISGLAGLFGYVMGLFIASRTAPLLGAQSAIVFFNGKIFLFSMVLSIIVGISAAIYPAFKASRLDPTVALRAL
ncbi:MAG: FtsX-like permease family protein, partial [Candidatus Aminicenantes bacterium]|nr:FtsX-like permease family protein [Candidatus Aminicenantes bacterium]